MIDLILIITLIIILLVASLTDIKTREVPDFITYGSIFLALTIRLIYSLSTSQFNYIIDGLIGFGAMFALALILFYTGQWGGADSKLLMGVGAFLGLPLTIHTDLVSFIINLIFVGAVYGLVISFFMVAKNAKNFKKAFKKFSNKIKNIRITVIIIDLILLALIFIIQTLILKLLFLTIIIILTISLYLYLYTKAIEQSSMLKTVPISTLTIGDWVAKEVRVKNKVIAGPKDLGLTKEQIETLKKLKVKQVQIKVGIPFVPSFLIAYVLTLLIGNLFFLMLF